MSSQFPTNIGSRVLGGMFMGVILDSILIGISTVQINIYCHKHTKDSTIVKFLVGLCSLLILVAAILNSYTIYLCAVSEFGNIPQLIIPKRTLYASVLSTLLPSNLIQVFFAWRVKRLTGQLWVLIVVIVLALTQAGLAFSFTAIGIRAKTYGEIAGEKPYLISWFCADIAINVLNSAHLINSFRSKRTGWRDTDDLLNRLTAATMKNGFVVAVWSIVTLFAILFAGNSTALAFVLPAPPIYLISLLTTLNTTYKGTHSRIRWADGELGLNSSSFARRTWQSRSTPFEVHVTRTIEGDEHELEHKNTTGGTRPTSTCRPIDDNDNAGSGSATRDVYLSPPQMNIQLEVKRVAHAHAA